MYLSFTFVTTFGASFRTTSWHRATVAAVTVSIFLAFFDLSIVLSAPLGELLHCCSFIKQAQANATKEVFQVQYTFETQDTTNGIGRSSSFTQPFQCLLTIKLNSSRNSQGIVST